MKMIECKIGACAFTRPTKKLCCFIFKIKLNFNCYLININCSKYLFIIYNLKREMRRIKRMEYRAKKVKKKK